MCIQNQSQIKVNQSKNHKHVFLKKINVKSYKRIKFFCSVNVIKSVGVNGI